ncbi:MAG: PAS domain-containing sensor histidine kinase [Bacillota bacterium]
MNRKKRMSQRKKIKRALDQQHTAVRVTGYYFVFGLLWIFLTDMIVFKLYESHSFVKWLQIYKGTAFILATSIMIFGLIYKDTEKLKQVEETLKENEERFRLAIDSGTGGIWDWDLVTGYVYVSKSLKENLGYDDMDIENTLSAWQALLHIEDLNRIVQELYDYREGKTPKYETEYRLKAKDGSYRWVLSRGRVIKDDEGNAARMIGTYTDITERKEKESFYKSLYENHHIVMLVIHPKTGDIIHANPAACSFYGYTKEELLQMNIDQINTMSDEALKKEMENAENYRKNFFQFKHRTAAGEIKDVETYSGPVTIGDVKYLYSFIHDVTEKKRIEEKLRQSEEQYRNLIEFLPDAVAIYDTKGILFVNMKIVKLLDYAAKEEFLGKSVPEFIHGDYRQLTMDRLRMLKEKAVTTLPPIETKLIKRNGETIDVEGLTGVVNYDGTEAFISVIRDISDRKQKEQEIKKLNGAIEQSPAGIMITDSAGNIEYINPKFTQVSGYTLEELVGRKPSILSAKEEEYREIGRKIGETILSGREWRGEIMNKRKNGELYWASVSISPIINDEGTITNSVAVQEDITEIKASEYQLKEVNGELEAALTTLKETQSKLVQQEKLAGIGHLAAGIAHEINNPLGFVLSNFGTLNKYIQVYQEILRLYKECKADAKLEANGSLVRRLEAIEKIERERQLTFIEEDLMDLLEDSKEGLYRISEIVKGMRSFSRIDHSEKIGEYSLNEGIRTTLIVAKNEIKYYAETREELGDIPEISGFGSQINQVLLNIILNGVYAIRQKQMDELGTIYIKTYHDQQYVYCLIEDNGTGIAEENLESIFNPFFTTKPVGEGTGLGLSIAYDIIVNKHKGDIGVESKIGVGTEFIIKLPINH